MNDEESEDGDSGCESRMAIARWAVIMILQMHETAVHGSNDCLCSIGNV
jgi:hypothetical protein